MQFLKWPRSSVWQRQTLVVCLNERTALWAFSISLGVHFLSSQLALKIWFSHQQLLQWKSLECLGGTKHRLSLSTFVVPAERCRQQYCPELPFFSSTVVGIYHPLCCTSLASWNRQMTEMVKAVHHSFPTLHPFFFFFFKADFNPLSHFSWFCWIIPTSVGYKIECMLLSKIKYVSRYCCFPWKTGRHCIYLRRTL